MKIFGLEPSPADIERIAALATAALPTGAVGDERIWLDAVRHVQPRFNWSNHPRVTERYKSWLNGTWQALLNQRIVESNRLWEHVRFAPLARNSRQVYMHEQKDLSPILRPSERASSLINTQSSLTGDGSSGA